MALRTLLGPLFCAIVLCSGCLRSAEPPPGGDTGSTNEISGSSAAPCMAGEMRPEGDGCNSCVCHDGGWLCTQRACDEGTPTGCQDGDTRTDTDGCNTCTCEAGEWVCTEEACGPCEDGATKDAEDGCNTCVCENGTWACTDQACPGCVPGSEKAADDGCNTCVCTDGGWACTDEECTEVVCTGLKAKACDAEPECTAIDMYALIPSEGNEHCVDTKAQYGGCMRADHGCGDAESLWCDTMGRMWQTPSTCGPTGFTPCGDDTPYEPCAD